jgi:hypothetical protein
LRSLLHIAELRRHRVAPAPAPVLAREWQLCRDWRRWAILGGCVRFHRAENRCPQVGLRGGASHRIVESKAEISVRLRLVEPQRRGTRLINELAYEITLDGRHGAASGRTQRVDRLPPGGEGTVELSGRVDVGAVATAMMALGSQLPVPYTLSGAATVQNGLSLSFSRKGEIAVSRFGPAAGSRPR